MTHSNLVFVGIGVDLVDIHRFSLLLDVAPTMKSRIFFGEELTFNTKKLAGKFAAKEAVRKSLNEITSRVDFRDIMIANKEDGAPTVYVIGKHKTLIEHSGISFQVSISYASGLVIASAIALKRITNQHQ